MNGHRSSPSDGCEGTLAVRGHDGRVHSGIRILALSGGHVDPAKINAATEEQIAAWKRKDGIDDTNLPPVRAVPPITDVRALREKLDLSQEEFAERYMLSLRTVQEWEQRRPEKQLERKAGSGKLSAIDSRDISRGFCVRASGLALRAKTLEYIEPGFFLVVDGNKIRKRLIR